MSQRDISYEREREAYFFFLRAAGFSPPKWRDLPSIALEASADAALGPEDWLTSPPRVAPAVVRGLLPEASSSQAATRAPYGRRLAHGSPAGPRRHRCDTPRKRARSSWRLMCCPLIPSCPSGETGSRVLGGDGPRRRTWPRAGRPGATFLWERRDASRQRADGRASMTLRDRGLV